MASASTVETFDCTPEQLYKILVDYEKYPEILTEVNKVQVIDNKPEHKIVEFQVSLIKTFAYRLKMSEIPNKAISWTLDSGDIFKTSVGEWKLEESGGKTKAHYSVEATFKVFVPGPIAKALVSVNLPAMMNAYKKRVKELYG